MLATVLAASLIFFLPAIWRAIVNHRKLDSIPTVGFTGFLTSYASALKYLKHSHEIVQEGYNKYRGSIFKVPTMTRWMIVVSGPDKIEELHRAPDDILSIAHAVLESLHMDVTLGFGPDEKLYHVDVIKTTLTRNIGAMFDDLRDEIATAFSQYIPGKEDEWVKVTAYSTVMDIVCRAANRLLVGLPLCREADYLDLVKRFVINLVKAGQIINLFPTFLRPIVGRLCISVSRDLRRGMEHLGPLINERLELERQYGKDWPGKPNDVISWLLDISTDRTTWDIMIRILIINLGAIHTTTMAFTHVLYDLAARPEYAEPLRKEIEAVVYEEGWSKASLDKLRKMDSFIKESLRFSSISSLVMMRKVMKDFTFSDGTTIPAGNLISVPISGMHVDADHFSDPHTFDGFRFERLRDELGVDGVPKHQLVSIDLNYILFGQGRHACPGRFLAASEVKTMLGHILLNYDIKMENGHERPQNWWFGPYSLPNPMAKVMFRKRG